MITVIMSHSARIRATSAQFDVVRRVALISFLPRLRPSFQMRRFPVKVQCVDFRISATL